VALQDPSPMVRKAACLSFTNLADPAAAKVVIARLSDEDEAVRASAAEILRQHGDQTRSWVLDIFKSENPPVDAALDALTPGQPSPWARCVTTGNCSGWRAGAGWRPSEAAPSHAMQNRPGKPCAAKGDRSLG
jgi:HEAT repeat protein